MNIKYASRLVLARRRIPSPRENTPAVSTNRASLRAASGDVVGVDVPKASFSWVETRRGVVTSGGQ
jgi:hypothetical protein